jgi:hypothetical protein
MTSRFAFATGLAAAALVFIPGAGCTSTSAGGIAPDGAAMTPDAQGDVPLDDAGAAACAAAGGQCVGFPFGGTCTLVGPAQACNSDRPGGSFCCAIAADAGTCDDIKASKYDQSCTADTDCVAVYEGNSCALCALTCPGGAAISTGALARYTSDIANTTANVSTKRLACSSECGVTPPPRCVAGRCERGDFGAGSQTDAAADTGADAAMADAGTGDAADGRAADASAE